MLVRIFGFIMRRTVARLDLDPPGSRPSPRSCSGRCVGFVCPTLAFLVPEP